ncbi:MAG: Ribonuclease HII [Chlamydiae bacterium]|nr:Ribonuclease HII [Chlamydiota bacterium]
MVAIRTKRKETFRLKRLCNIEEQIRGQGFEIIAGVDEAGRGPLAGPLVAAACILPAGYKLRGIDDSKKLTGEQRYAFYQDLILHPEIHFGIGVIEAAEIDALNIHNATLEAMLRGIRRLCKRPQFLLIDGRHTPDSEIPMEAIVDGDRKAQAIAAASILAKVTRDHIMIGYHDLYPEYGFNEHKGYGTKQHLNAIDTHGPTPIHRMSFGKFKEEAE